MPSLFYVAQLNQRMNKCVGSLPLQWSRENFHCKSMTSYLRKSMAFKVSITVVMIGFQMLAPSISAVQIVAGIVGVNLIVFVGIFYDYLLFHDCQALVTSANFLVKKYQSLGLTQRNITMFPFKILIYFTYLTLYFFSARRFSSISTNKVLHHPYVFSKYISVYGHCWSCFYKS